MESPTQRWKRTCLVSLMLTFVVAGMSLPAHALVLEPSSLAPPAKIQASDGTFSDRIRVEWTATAGAAFYEIARSTREFSAYSPLAITVDPWYEDRQLLPSQSYYYRVRVHNGEVAGSWSPSDLGYWAFLPPSVVLASAAAFPDRIRVAWEPVPVTQYYYLYRAVHEQGPYMMIGMIRETWYEDAGISPGKAYYYKLRSLTSSTASRMSSWAVGSADATLSISRRYHALTR